MTQTVHILRKDSDVCKDFLLAVCGRVFKPDMCENDKFAVIGKDGTWGPSKPTCEACILVHFNNPSQALQATRIMENGYETK